jgi:hypothetical protein
VEGERDGWRERTHIHTQTHTDTETLVYISRVHPPQTTQRILMLLNHRLTSTDVTHTDVTHTNVTHTNVTHTNVTHTNVTHTNEPVASVSATDHAEEVTH